VVGKLLALVAYVYHKRRAQATTWVSLPQLCRWAEERSPQCQRYQECQSLKNQHSTGQMRHSRGSAFPLPDNRSAQTLQHKSKSKYFSS